MFIFIEMKHKIKYLNKKIFSIKKYYQKMTHILILVFTQTAII